MTTFPLPEKGAENIFYRTTARNIARSRGFDFQYVTTKLDDDGKRHWVLRDEKRKMKARLLDMRGVVLLTKTEFIEQHLIRPGEDVKAVLEESMKRKTQTKAKTASTKTSKAPAKATKTSVKSKTKTSKAPAKAKTTSEDPSIQTAAEKLIALNTPKVAVPATAAPVVETA